MIPNPVAWLLFEKVWEFGGVGVWGEKPLPHPQTPTPPYLNYAIGFGMTRIYTDFLDPRRSARSASSAFYFKGYKPYAARSAVIVRMTAAVQKTGLVMQWCPLQLPSGFWTLERRVFIFSYHVSQSSPPVVASDSLVIM